MVVYFIHLSVLTLSQIVLIFKGLRFGGSGAWNPCDLPQPVLVFNPNNESFFIDLNILENRYNLTIDSLPPFLIADLIKGVWVAASVAPTTPVRLDRMESLSY